jgi:acyl-coenzyme A thioesterase PaaI-like protein
MMNPYIGSLISREITRAETSSLHLWILNRLLLYVIPFNRPHGLKVLHISRTDVDISLPYRIRNQNHVGGLHACALATCAEYAAGLILLYNFLPDKNRLLLKRLEITFEKQARAGVTARCTIEPAYLRLLNESLLENGSFFVSLPVEVRSDKNDVVCRLQVDWQVKRWELVRSHSKAQAPDHST